MKQSLHRPRWPAPPCWPSASGSARSRQVPRRRTSPAAPPAPSTTAAHRPDNRPGPLTKQAGPAAHQGAGHARAAATPSSSKRSGGGATVTLERRPAGRSTARADSFEFPVNRTDQIWTVLARVRRHRSAAQRDRRSPDRSRLRQLDVLGRRTSTRPTTTSCSTAPASRSRDYYKKLSGGRYNVGSTVEDWVQVPGDAADYGANARRGRRRLLAVHRRHRRRVVRRAGRGRQDDGRRSTPTWRTLDAVGPLRLRQRRQLQRGRRLHRPLPGRARR